MCVNCNDSLQVNLPIGPAGINGTDGVNAYLYTASVTNPTTGAGYTFPASPSQTYFGLVNTSTPFPINPTFSQFQNNPGFIGWYNLQGPQGIQGIQGVQGPLGPFGGVTFEYNYLGPSVSVTPPGNGNLGVSYTGFLLNSLFLSTQDLNGGSLSSYFQYIRDISSSSKAVVRIAKKTDTTAYQVYRITSGTNSGGYYTYTLAPNPLAFGPTALQTGDDLLVSFSAIGDRGDYVTTATEAPGVNCALGGLKVEVRDGVTGSVISTNYVCKQDNIAAGIVNWFAGTAAPSGYLLCDGSAISALTFPNLYAAIGNTYDTFNGASAPGGVLFRVPDLRGLFIRGNSQGSTNFDPSGATRNVGDLQLDAFQSHRHSYTNYVAYTDDNEAGATTDVLSFDNPGHGTGTNQTNIPNTGGFSPDNARLSTETRPVNVSLLPCIKY